MNGKKMMNEDLVFRLRKRAEIRRQISTRKSVQENKPDRIADLLEEAAQALEDNKSEILSLEDRLWEAEYFSEGFNGGMGQ